MRATGFLFALIALLIVLVLGALWSTAGNRLLVRMAEEALDPALRVSNVSGSILSDLCADEVLYQTEGVQVRIREICVNPRLWSSVDFLKVEIASLRAAGVWVETLPDAGSVDDGTALYLPVDILAEAVFVEHLQINELALTEVRAVMDLSNSDLQLAASFAYQSYPVELSTSDGWSALRFKVFAHNADLEGTVDLLAEQLPWTASLSSDLLDLSPFADRAVQLHSLTLEGSGDRASYRVDGNAEVRDELGRTAVSLSGEGAADGLRFDRLELTYLTLDELPIEIDVLRSSGVISWAERLRIELNDTDLVGKALDQPVSVSAEKLVVTDADLDLTAGSVTIQDDAEVRLSGRLTFEGALDLAVTTERFPLALADTRLGGLADLQGTIAGTLADPFVDGSAEVTSLSWQGEEVGDVSNSLQGSLQRGDVQLALTSREADGEVAFGYERIGSDYEVRLRSAVGRYAPLAARAQLIEPVTAVLGEERMYLENACVRLSSDQLNAEPGRLCADLDYPGGGLMLNLEPWQVPRLPLPDSEVTLNGGMELAIALTGFEPFAGSARISFSDLMAYHPDLDPLRLGNLDTRVEITDDRLKATLSTPSDPPQELLFNGALESVLTADPLESPISGSVYMELDGIWVAQSLLPMEVTYELDDVRGQMTVNAVVTGQVGDPVIDGSLKLSEAGWHVPAVNAGVNDLTALATLRGSERIDFRADAAVGAGSLALEGGIVGIGSDAPRLNTSVLFDGAELLDLPDYQAAVDGELTLQMGTDDLLVKGDLRLPRADVLIADLPETAVTASADEVIVDEEQATNVQQLRSTDVTLTLGDEVYLEAFGLSGRLSGNLRVVEAPGRLRSVTGVISLNDARFEAYGQELIVDRGNLTFSGPIDDPTVDVVASRVVDYDDREYRISLVITGTAKDLQTVVRSQPSLPEDDALALLITGRTFSQISSNEQSNVYGAALSMGLLSATGVTQNLASALSLEEIIVDQDAQGNMEVGAAVRLNRNLYLRYTYGVFSRLGGVLLRYRFSTRFSVQAKTGDAHSIEIRYGVDE